MEQRRFKAARLFAQDIPPAEVARRLDVSCQSAVNWLRAWQRSGAEGLHGAGRAGRLPRLDAEQRAEVEKQLMRGAKANGFGADLWTLQRVAQVIEHTTGVAYHQGHVWRILRGMGWSRQRPARRAVERDDTAIEQWVKERWPAVKKRHKAKGLDHLRRRERLLAHPVGPQHLGSPRADPCPETPLWMEACLGGWAGRIPLRWPTRAPLRAHPARGI